MSNSYFTVAFTPNLQAAKIRHGSRKAMVAIRDRRPELEQENERLPTRVEPAGASGPAHGRAADGERP